MNNNQIFFSFAKVLVSLHKETPHFSAGMMSWFPVGRPQKFPGVCGNLQCFKLRRPVPERRRNAKRNAKQ